MDGGVSTEGMTGKGPGVDGGRGESINEAKEGHRRRYPTWSLGPSGVSAGLGHVMIAGAASRGRPIAAGALALPEMPLLLSGCLRPAIPAVSSPFRVSGLRVACSSTSGVLFESVWTLGWLLYLPGSVCCLVTCQQPHKATVAGYLFKRQPISMVALTML